jgi:DMSO/TMAO reductase YedYZ molybdopterin-dependent catalytic subunit
MVDGLRAVPAGLRARRLPRWSWRTTNLGVFVTLALAFATGLAAVATGSPRGAAVVVAHGVVGIAVVLLAPWKGRVVAGGVRRSRPNRGMSIALAVLTVGSLVFGFASSTGLARTIAGRETLWVHIALALLLVPLLAWHVVARPVRPRRADVSRRVLLRAGLLAAVGGALYAAAEGGVRLTGLAGAHRRFTGSYAADPDRMPVVSWLDDAVPGIDVADWQLAVTDATGSRALSLDGLAALDTVTVRATLDCTSGWYATQDWTGVPLSRLVGAGPEHRSVRVRSVTGFDRYLPVSDLGSLLLATACGGAPLTAGHGFPARLVAPGRRGFWWVKWVVGVELSRRPWWTQSPFPYT